MATSIHIDRITRVARNAHEIADEAATIMADNAGPARDLARMINALSSEVEKLSAAILREERGALIDG